MVTENKIPEGYKQTEVGVIPEDWAITRIGDVSQIFGRIGFRGYTVNDITEEGQGAISVSPSNLIDGKTDFSKCTYISWAKYEESPEIKLANGDILLVKTGSTFGKTAIVRDLPQKATLNPQVVVLKKTKMDNVLLGYVMGFHIIQNQISSAVVGGALPTLSQKKVSQFIFPLPPLPEQTAIATALSDIDSLITSLDKLIAKKRNIKQGAMQELLTGKRRLPGFSGEWEAARFSDIADKSIPWSIAGGPFGSSLKASEYTDAGVRIIQLQNIGDGFFQDEYAIYTSESKANELLSNNIYPGEIIISKMGDPVARACFIPTNASRFLMASDGIRLVVDAKQFDKRFVHDYINSPYFRKKAIEVSTGTTRQRIGLTDLKQLPFIAPPLAEQRAIAEILTDMDDEIISLENKRDKYTAIKQGMMQQLLTGKIRLI